MSNTISYHSKLVGVTFEGRQDVIKVLKGDEELRFRREPHNEHDKDAVAVDVFIDDEGILVGETPIKVEGYWKPIGFISRDNNNELARVLDDGKFASIKLSEITGGNGKSYGVNVYIEYEKGRKKVRSENAKLVKDIFDNEIFYDEVTHEYTNALGEVYISGSKYAESFEKPFDAKLISSKLVTKNGLNEDQAQEIQDMWRLKAVASASLGTAIHAALELYGRFKKLAESIGKETHLHDNTVLGRAVTSFYDQHPDVDNVKYEALVVDHSKQRAGRIDRLEYDKDGGVWVTDFKTNADVVKSLKKYWLQLSFYAAIITANGLKVKGLKIYHYNGEEWVTIVSEVIDIDKEES